MAYKYASNTFLVPTGYNTDLTLVPNMIANWLKSTFSLTEYKVSTGTNSSGRKYHYIYLRVPETDILVEEGVYNNGDSFFMTVGRIGAIQAAYGFSISANAIIQVAIAQLYPDFIILNPSVGNANPIASVAMIMQELSTGADRILVRNAYMGSSTGDAAGFNIFLPRRYGWFEDNSFKYADYVLFPDSLSPLKGSVEKETGNKDKCLLMTPVLYSTTSPIGAVVAKKDRLKLIINNDDTLPKETGEVPITIGTKHYIGVSSSTYAYICVD